MQEITVLSGKGGTGKTSITAALASLTDKAVFCDNDVDAADLHLILNPHILEQHQFDSGSKASINADLCTDCGLCEQNCRFDAIHRDKSGKLVVNKFQCEGCRLCERICPADAITSEKYNNNSWFISDTRFGKLVHAKMGAGEENSGKLVTNIRTKVRELAINEKADYIISDGSPGIGCPVIASITGTDTVLLVIEPSLTGLHDVQRLYDLVKSFNIPAFALINKSDINPKITQKVKLFLNENNLPLLGEIPFDPKFVDAMIQGKTIIEFSPDSDLSSKIRSIWKQLAEDI